ncbi:MAG: SHOCT domain-containing protein [Alphaproteobacteria bacterium]|nr:SHOCT domain-containing protein [Alphaproteobacteria bacterium]
MNGLKFATVNLLSIAAAASPAWADKSDLHYGPHMWTYGWHGGFIGPIMMFVFLAVLVVMAVLLVRWLGGTTHGGMHHAPPGKTPLDILKERFARGEIDKAEFEERRSVLEA